MEPRFTRDRGLPFYAAHLGQTQTEILGIKVLARVFEQSYGAVSAEGP